MSAHDAQLLANDANLDLVEISPTATPPVVKIIDWGKYQYQKTKELGRAKKKAKNSELKQIRTSLRIGENDLNIKLKKIHQFLAAGDRVKITIVLKGREMAHKELATALMTKITTHLSETAAPDSPPQFAGRNLSITVHKK
jgi:translation initiation factor IF-3